MMRSLWQCNWMHWEHCCERCCPCIFVKKRRPLCICDWGGGRFLAQQFFVRNCLLLGSIFLHRLSGFPGGLVKPSWDLFSSMLRRNMLYWWHKGCSGRSETESYIGAEKHRTSRPLFQKGMNSIWMLPFWGNAHFGEFLQEGSFSKKGWNLT